MDTVHLPQLAEVTEVTAEVSRGEREGDMQKKITRWTSGAGVRQELFPQLSHDLSHDMRGRPTGGLVLVASLLNKIPNLGGW